MSPSALPTRITIDFRESLNPARGWILGVGEAPSRVELLAFEPDADDEGGRPAALDNGCTCPDFCERDHDLD